VSEAAVYHVSLKMAMDMYLSRFFILSQRAFSAFMEKRQPKFAE